LFGVSLFRQADSVSFSTSAYQVATIVYEFIVVREGSKAAAEALRTAFCFLVSRLATIGQRGFLGDH
jgi:hypothetical protein